MNLYKTSDSRLIPTNYHFSFVEFQIFHYEQTLRFKGKLTYQTLREVTDTLIDSNEVSKALKAIARDVYDDN